MEKYSKLAKHLEKRGLKIRADEVLEARSLSDKEFNDKAKIKPLTLSERMERLERLHGIE